MNVQFMNFILEILAKRISQTVKPHKLCMYVFSFRATVVCVCVISDPNSHQVGVPI